MLAVVTLATMLATTPVQESDIDDAVTNLFWGVALTSTGSGAVLGGSTSLVSNAVGLGLVIVTTTGEVPSQVAQPYVAATIGGMLASAALIGAGAGLLYFGHGRLDTAARGLIGRQSIESTAPVPSRENLRQDTLRFRRQMHEDAVREKQKREQEERDRQEREAQADADVTEDQAADEWEKFRPGRAVLDTDEPDAD